MSTGKNMNRDMRQIKQQIKHLLPKNQRRINIKKKKKKQISYDLWPSDK